MLASSTINISNKGVLVDGPTRGCGRRVLGWPEAALTLSMPVAGPSNLHLALCLVRSETKQPFVLFRASAEVTWAAYVDCTALLPQRRR